MKKIFLLLLLSLAIATPAFAFDIQKLANVPVEKDFTLGPGKVELFLDPGEEQIRNLLITNRLGYEMNFKIEIEDFIGSPAGDRAAILLGLKKGPYSLRDYLEPEVMSFSLKHGERMVLPVKVNIPSDMEPGGFYGSVIVSTSPMGSDIGREDNQTKGQVKLVARIGSLFFVRVNGDVEEGGYLHEFNTLDSRKIFPKVPVTFSIKYKNNGNVHVDPYGIVEIKNILGKKIGEIEVEPYFAMPQSMRYREFDWDNRLSLGYYTAELFLNRGYDDIIDTAKVSFFILPWKILLMLLGAIFVIVWLIWWVSSRFEFRRKK